MVKWLRHVWRLQHRSKLTTQHKLQHIKHEWPFCRCSLSCSHRPWSYPIEMNMFIRQKSDRKVKNNRQKYLKNQKVQHKQLWQTINPKLLVHSILYYYYYCCYFYYYNYNDGDYYYYYLGIQQPISTAVSGVNAQLSVHHMTLQIKAIKTKDKKNKTQWQYIWHTTLGWSRHQEINICTNVCTSSSKLLLHSIHHQNIA